MLRELGLLIAVAVAALAVSGCGEVVAGGDWLNGRNSGKATFGSTLNPDGQGFLKGSYRDPGADPAVNIRFQGPAFPLANTGVVMVLWTEQDPRSVMAAPWPAQDSASSPCRTTALREPWAQGTMSPSPSTASTESPTRTAEP